MFLFFVFVLLKTREDQFKLVDLSPPGVITVCVQVPQCVASPRWVVYQITVRLILYLFSNYSRRWIPINDTGPALFDVYSVS